MTSSSFSKRRGRRILICVRGNCAHPDQGRQLEQCLVTLIEQHGLDDPAHPQHVSCTLTNCLGVCIDGPIMMVHPEGIRYHHVDEAALDRIFHEHLLDNRPVEALIRHDQPAISVRQRMNGRKRRRRRFRRARPELHLD